jgi:predicted DNA-binding transcriptional regulator YafY
VELYLSDHPPCTVEPLGLVLKAGSWYLVVRHGDAAGAMCLDELRATRLTAQPSTAPPQFSLIDLWAAHVRDARPQ